MPLSSTFGSNHLDAGFGLEHFPTAGQLDQHTILDSLSQNPLLSYSLDSSLFTPVQPYSDYYPQSGPDPPFSSNDPSSFGTPSIPVSQHVSPQLSSDPASQFLDLDADANFFNACVDDPTLLGGFMKPQQPLATTSAEDQHQQFFLSMNSQGMLSINQL